MVLTVFCTFGLAAVSTWFAAERWAYSKHNGLRWLSDVLEERWRAFIKYPPVLVIRYIPRKIGQFSQKTAGRIKDCFAFRKIAESDIEDTLPFPHWMENGREPSPDQFREPKASISMEKGLEKAANGPESITTTTTSVIPPRKPSTDDTAPIFVKAPKRLMSLVSAVSNQAAVNAQTPSISTIAASASVPTAGPSETTAVPAASAAASRFRAIGWRVIKEQAAATAKDEPTNTEPARTATLLSDPGQKRRHREGTGGTSQPKLGRLTAIRPRLKNLQVTHTIFDHSALVRHLQFSPDGNMLATCGWDGTARLFEIPQSATDQVGRYKTLAASGFLGQVAWSKDGKHILVKWTTGIQIWGTDGVKKKKIARGKPVRSVVWFPSSQGMVLLSR